MSSDAEIADRYKAIERAFFRIDDGETDHPTCSVSIEIKDIGCWIVKFSRNGVVVNNCDIIFTIEPKDCSANVQFKSHRFFLNLTMSLLIDLPTFISLAFIILAS